MVCAQLTDCDRVLQEPKLWYGIGILYDRYGSLDHAEEAFSQVMRMAPDFEKANEIYFRLGIIYKQQQKFSQSLEVCNIILKKNFKKKILLLTRPVLQIHRQRPSPPLDGGRHLVPDWPCPRATEGL